MHFFAFETIINKKRAVRQIILASTANIGYNVREKNQTGCARTSSAPPKSNDPFTTNIALKRGNLIETPSYMALPIGRQPQRMLLHRAQAAPHKRQLHTESSLRAAPYLCFQSFSHCCSQYRRHYRSARSMLRTATSTMPRE